VKSSFLASRPSIRVLLADSNQTQAQLLSRALRRQPGLNVACCRGELPDCLQALRSTQVDVVLVSDSPADHIHLIDFLRDLFANNPGIRLILLLDSYDRSFVVDALQAGARGLFCRASQPFRALCRCISAVHQGQIWASTEHLNYLIEALRSPASTCIINAKGEGVLTARENQVVSLVAEGIVNREIAQQLGVKENTVKKSLFRIYDKVGVSNRVELVLYALTHGSTQTGAPSQVKMSPGSERFVSGSLEAARIKLLGTN
jgi:two-component system, NarL family, response regulator DegU